MIVSFLATLINAINKYYKFTSCSKNSTVTELMNLRQTKQNIFCFSYRPNYSKGL